VAAADTPFCDDGHVIAAGIVARLDRASADARVAVHALVAIDLDDGNHS
jgi:hypothetical protein